jgi:hypothetical protein
MKRYFQLPDLLEAALSGLSESDLDLALADGWSVRQYAHHTVEGELIWQVNLRAVAGSDGIAFPMDWYLTQPQETWAERWAYDRRPIQPSIDLFRASTRNLVHFLEALPSVWNHSGHVTFPGASQESVFTVRDIVLMHIRHTQGHVRDIHSIRTYHDR